MAAIKEDIRRWLEEGKEAGATHMLVVCDTFDWEDYPVYIYLKDKALSKYDRTDVHKAYEHYNGPNMQKVMEVYSYALPLESQLQEHQSLHFEGVVSGNSGVESESTAG